MSGTFSYDSTWRIEAPVERCWAEIERMLRPDATSTWWPSVTIEAPAALAVGDEITLAVQTPLGDPLLAKISITGIDSGRSISASSGEDDDDTRGEGGVEVRDDGDGVSLVVFHWDVVAKKLLRRASMIALRPIFEPVITDIMKEGEDGLRAVLVTS